MANSKINLPQGPLPDGDPNNFQNTGWTKDQVKQMAEEDPTFKKFQAKVGQETDFAKKVGVAAAGTVAGGLATGALGGAAASGTAGGDVAGGSENDPYGDGSQDLTPDEWKAMQSGGSNGGNGFSASDVLGLVKQYGPTVLEGLNVYQAAQNAGKSQQYAQDAVKGTTDAYAAKAPLRALGIAGLQNPGANVPDLSNIRQLSTAGSGNPFAKALPVAGAATGFKPGVAPGVTPTQGALPLALGQVAQGQPAVPSFTSPGSPYANPKKSVLPVAS